MAKKTTPAHIPVTPQPMWGSIRLKDETLSAPEWWFFSDGKLYPMRACFEATPLPISDFISMPAEENIASGSLVNDEQIVMPVLNAYSIDIGQKYPARLVNNQLITFEVSEIVPHDPPDGYKDLVMTRIEDTDIPSIFGLSDE